MAKIGPNQPCPCGSGKKFKKCCGGPNAPRLLPYTQADRVSALEELQFFENELY